MKKAKKFIVMLSVLAIAASLMISCSNSSPEPKLNITAEDVVNAEYATDFSTLFGLLNTFGGIEDLPVGEETDFVIMGVNIGKITVKSYDAENKSYAYEATFKAGSHSDENMTVTVTVGNDISIEYEQNGEKGKLSALMNGGSSLNVDVVAGIFNLNISAELPFDLYEDSSSVKVGDNVYSADDQLELMDFCNSLDEIIDGMGTDGTIPSELKDEEDGSFALTKTAGTGEAWSDTTYEGTITTISDDSYDVIVSVHAENNAWAYSAISIDGKEASASAVDKINTPYINL